MQPAQPRKRGSNAKRRRGARQKAMQALYQWDFDQSAHSPEQVVEQFCGMQNMDRVDIEYFKALFMHAAENTPDIDTEISRHLDRKLDQLDPIERSVLRICCVELKTQLGTPYKVVVNEALEISKDFGADKGFRYINGIADKLAASLRQIEYTRDHPDGNPLSEQEIKQPTAKATQSNVKISIKEKTPEPAARKPSSGFKADSRKSGSDKAPGRDTHGNSDAKPVDEPTKKPAELTQQQSTSEQPKPPQEKPLAKQDDQDTTIPDPDDLPKNSPWAKSHLINNASPNESDATDSDNKPDVSNEKP